MTWTRSISPNTGSDFELAQGFLLTEHIIEQRDDVETIRYCGGTGPDGANTYNILYITLAPKVPAPDVDVTRNFYTTSSCGVCGKASLDAVRLTSRYPLGDEPARVAAQTLTTMPKRLRSAQKVFASTGGLHAAALFDVDGTMRVSSVVASGGFGVRIGPDAGWFPPRRFDERLFTTGPHYRVGPALTTRRMSETILFAGWP